MTMNILNENKKRNIIIAAATPVLTMAVIAFAAYSITTILSSYVGSSSRPLQAAYAQEAKNTTTTTTTTSDTSSAGIHLSPQPIMQEQTTTTSQTPINQTHISATFTGNGTLSLPNSTTTNTTTDTINFTTNGTALISLVTHSTQAKATITTEQGETATATFYEILKIDPTAAAGSGRGLTMAMINTNSIGMLAPLNGTIVAGISNLQSNEANTVTLWKWESGIGNNDASDDDGSAASVQ